jgi:hypothetical protein
MTETDEALVRRLRRERDIARKVAEEAMRGMDDDQLAALRERLDAADEKERESA